MLGLMKSLIFVVGLTIFMASLIMAFELPTHKETLSAIGSTNALPHSLQRAFSIDDFEPIPVPEPNDWLAEHHENGQTYDDFLQSDRNSPDEIRNLIYLQPIGQFRQRQSPTLDLLKEYTEAYFSGVVPITLSTVIAVRECKKFFDRPNMICYACGHRRCSLN